jgi:hypothetical protein
MPQMKLGWWRDREGREHEIVKKWDDAYLYSWTSPRLKSWNDNGRYLGNDKEDPLDLIEFLRPLEDLPPALNSAVKAAEDRVRELKQVVDETQTAWATACRLHEAAQRELERLEKECEVGK